MVVMKIILKRVKLFEKKIKLKRIFNILIHILKSHFNLQIIHLIMWVIMIQILKIIKLKMV